MTEDNDKICNRKNNEKNCDQRNNEKKVEFKKKCMPDFLGLFGFV